MCHLLLLASHGRRSIKNDVCEELLELLLLLVSGACRDAIAVVEMEEEIGAQYHTHTHTHTHTRWTILLIRVLRQNRPRPSEAEQIAVTSFSLSFSDTLLLLDRVCHTYARECRMPCYSFLLPNPSEVDVCLFSHSSRLSNSSHYTLT
jgi:hypothetical protein